VYYYYAFFRDSPFIDPDDLSEICEFGPNELPVHELSREDTESAVDEELNSPGNPYQELQG
jgi:hypothetical protein